MTAGQYKTPIQILKLKVERNKYGEQIDTYNEVINTRANVYNVSSQRQHANSEVFYTDVKRLTVRMYVDVAEFDHIRIKGKDYKILAIIPDDTQNQKVLNIELINE